MSPEVLVLCGTAATIAFVHTLLGPDHYLPFVAMAKSRGWSPAPTVHMTLICGSGHIVGSVVLGFAGLYFAIQLDSLGWIEGLRGEARARAFLEGAPEPFFLALRLAGPRAATDTAGAGYDRALERLLA